MIDPWSDDRREGTRLNKNDIWGMCFAVGGRIPGTTELLSFVSSPAMASKTKSGYRKSTRARTNWLLRQIAASDPSHLHVKALWPRRRVPTQETLEVARADPDALGGPNRGLSPRAFEVRFVRDAGARFVGAKTFIDELEASVLQFYAEVGQRLKQWQPTAPKVVAKETSTASREGVSDGAAGTDQEARGLADGEGAGLLERGQC